MESELEMKKEIDVGLILDTTIPLKLFIPITNRSERTVNITRVSKDCSCTAVTIEKQKLAPGETTSLRVITNLSGKTNLFVSSIVVESDASEKMDEILIHGKITGQIRIRPQRTTLVMGDEYKTGEFTIFCDDQTGKWKYEGFKSDDPDLVAEITPTATSPTTSTYAGVVSMNRDLAKEKPADYRVSFIRFKFVNEHLHKNLEVLFAVDIVVRRKVMTDPIQVTFGRDVNDQKRTVVVQSMDSLKVDSVACDSPCVKASLRRIDEKNSIVEIAYLASSIAGDTPSSLACNLISDGKVVGSIPVSLVDFR